MPMINTILNSVFDFPQIIKKNLHDEYDKDLPVKYFENLKIIDRYIPKKETPRLEVLLFSDENETEFVAVCPYGYSLVQPNPDPKKYFFTGTKGYLFGELDKNYQLSSYYVLLYGDFQLDPINDANFFHIHVMDYDIRPEELIKAIELVKKWNEKKNPDSPQNMKWSLNKINEIEKRPE
jgi:hypothetical protein